jgi:plasmid stabilization system protein ParE
MVTKIKWRKKALRQIKENALYLEENFSTQAANNLVQSIYKTIERVTEHPKSHRKAPKTKSVYFVNIDKNRQMFYRVEGKILIISSFFDTRQDPLKRPF